MMSEIFTISCEIKLCLHTVLKLQSQVTRKFYAVRSQSLITSPFAAIDNSILLIFFFLTYNIVLVSGIQYNGLILYIYFFFLFLAAPRGLWDLSSLTKDRTWALGSESTES